MACNELWLVVVHLLFIHIVWSVRVSFTGQARLNR